MTDKEHIRALYEAMYKAMIAKDTTALARILSEDSVLVHMTGHRQYRKEYLSEIASGTLNYYSVDTDSLEITVNGDSARMIGRSRVNAAVRAVDLTLSSEDIAFLEEPYKAHEIVGALARTDSNGI